MAPIPTPRYLLAAGLPSSARYAATVSVRGLLVAEIQVLVPHIPIGSIHPSIPRHRRVLKPNLYKCSYSSPVFLV